MLEVSVGVFFLLWMTGDAASKAVYHELPRLRNPTRAIAAGHWGGANPVSCADAEAPLNVMREEGAPCQVSRSARVRC